MNAHPTPSTIPPARRPDLASLFAFSSCRFRGPGRWLAGTLLLLLVAFAGNTPAQVIGDCVSVICPPPFVTNYVCNDQTQPAPYPLVVSNNCPNLPVAVVCNPPVGTPLPPGATVVNCTVSAGGVVVAACHFTVVVIIDTEPPVIICPPNLVVAACPNAAGGCAAVVVYPPPVATDNSGSVAVSCAPPSGATFPCGNTTVTCTAVDRCGNKRECQFIVRVTDQGERPRILCPPDQTLTTCSNVAVLAYPAPAVNPAGSPVTCVPPVGTLLPVGSHAVVCTVSNACGTDQCVFKVEVVRIPPVIIQCPTASFTAVVPCGSNCVPVFYPAPVVLNGALMNCNPPSGTCLPVGNYFVICRASNECGIASCEFPVVVIQGQGQEPTITCPSNLVATTCSNCAVVAYPAPVVVNGALVKCNPPSGSCFPIGTSTVLCEATNACGSSRCTFTITVREVPPAAIQCPAGMTFVVPCGSNCVPVVYPDPVVNNGTLVGCQPPSGTCLGVGNYFVICRATNSCGQAVGCEFPVVVIQGQGQEPTITCPSNLVATTCSNCAVVAYPAPVVVNGALVKCNPPSGSCFPIGTSTVLCEATNACGSSRCTFTITVRPVPPPLIHCPTNQIVVALPCGTNCIPVIYPAPVVLNGALVICTPPSGSCLPLGNTVVICRATNVCGDVAGCEFVVVVRPSDGEPPIIRCPEDITVRTCGDCEVVNYPPPVVINGILVGCQPPPGTCFPLGVTTVNCLATNDCGRAECKFTVTVRPVPTVGIICPSNIVVTTCGNGEIVNYPPPTLTGAANAAGVTVTCLPPSGSMFPVGTNVVTCCVVDECQRKECCEFLVIVVPGNPCVKPPLNMVLWLPFDEPVGVIAHNIIAGAPNALHINGPLPVIGQYVLNSLAFDGINDFVRVPNYAAIVLSSSDFSIDAWVLRRDQGPGRHVMVSKIGKAGTAAGAAIRRGYEYYLNNGLMNLDLVNGAVQNFNSGVPVPLDNAWHHVTVTVRRFGLAAGVRFYLDGVLAAALPGPVAAPIGNSSALFVGASTSPAPSSFFRGFIDEVEIFNRVLTPAQILSLWRADKAGKCKIKCSIPWDVSYRPGSNYVTVMARIWNCSGVPQPIHWVASGPMPIPTPNGSFILPPFTCTNIPVQLCRPTNGLLVGSVVRWTLSVFSGAQCPIECIGSVINPGPIIVTVPVDPVLIPGTNRNFPVRIGLNGLPPGQPVRLRAIGPDMEPDQTTISLNGLPPGTPLILGGPGGPPQGGFFDVFYTVFVRFLENEPIGAYPILVEADLDGDGTFETLSSFDAENSVVPPPTLRILSNAQGYYLDWQDEGDGYGELERTDDVVDGPWSVVPGGQPGHQVDLTKPHTFFRVAVPYVE